MREKLQTLMGGMESTVGPKLSIDDEIPPPFFGRGKDLAVLRRALAAFRNGGECRAITLVGPPGIGKTRLLDEFARELRRVDDPPIRTFRASAPAGGSSWAAFVQLLARRFGIDETSGLDEAKSSVRAHVVQVLDDRKVGDVLYLLGDLLDLEFPQSPLTRAFDEGSPETTVLKRAILKSFVEADAAFGPMCFMVDDLHHAHDQTLAMLRFLIEHLKAPVLFVCAGRPELLSRADALPDAPSHATLHLEPLAALDSAALIGSVLTPEGMTPMHLVEKARAITGGNPGRIEEVGRFYRGQGTLPPPPQGQAAVTEARLEELMPDERVLLQKAATMGGVFWLGGLIVLDRDNREPPELFSAEDEEGIRDLASLLMRLTERDYILRLPDSTFPGDEEYVFRHRTERDRIASLTSAADARKWHRLLADWLDSQPETRSHEEYLQLLGEQREYAGAKDSAARAYLEAAGQARAHGSPKRELAYCERALALIGEDSHSSRLSALVRAAELLDQVDREEEAVARYREAATLAFRLNRRRLWERAQLAASRLTERLATRAEARREAEAASQPVEPAIPTPLEPITSASEAEAFDLESERSRPIERADEATTEKHELPADEATTEKYDVAADEATTKRYDVAADEATTGRYEVPADEAQAAEPNEGVDRAAASDETDDHWESGFDTAFDPFAPATNEVVAQEESAQMPTEGEPATQPAEIATDLAGEAIAAPQTDETSTETATTETAAIETTITETATKETAAIETATAELPDTELPATELPTTELPTAEPAGADAPVETSVEAASTDPIAPAETLAEIPTQAEERALEEPPTLVEPIETSTVFEPTPAPALPELTPSPELTNQELTPSPEPMAAAVETAKEPETLEAETETGT